jgi:1-acyl-sn-glycerol-3-phosphate acyltransferase
MAEFKKGAFTVAAKEQVPVVPVTLEGTGRLMRNGAHYQMVDSTHACF